MANISNQLAGIDYTKIKMSNGLTIGNNLRIESRRLLKCIQDEIDNYYSSYRPEKYTRSYHFREALYAEDFINIKIGGNALYINLVFNENLSYHDSFSGEDVYVPLLINDGWSWDGWENAQDDHFHKYSGFHFLEKGIEKFNSTNSLGITVTLDKTWKGQHYSSSIYR